jgi:hypothetical protein
MVNHGAALDSPALSCLLVCKAMLEKAVAAVKEDKAKALEFSKGEGGFKDRDLYVFCANASDGTLTAHPSLRGEHLQDIKGTKGSPFGQEMMQKATEGTDGKEVANQKIPHTTPFLMTLGETFDVGSDTRTSVDDSDYQVPFAFTGKVEKVLVQLN